MAENPRTTTARDADDSDVIDTAVADADDDAVAGSSGGAIQRDVGSRADLKQDVDNPEGTTRPEKADDMAAGQSYPADRAPNRQ